MYITTTTCKKVLLGKEFLTFTAENTAISPNFLVWKFCGKAQFPQSFGRSILRSDYVKFWDPALIVTKRYIYVINDRSHNKYDAIMERLPVYLWKLSSFSVLMKPKYLILMPGEHAEI